MNFLIIVILLFTCYSPVNANPIIGEKAKVVEKNNYTLTTSLFYTNYTKKHDSDGAGVEFTSGENRLGYFLPIRFEFGISDTDEIAIVIPLYSVSHQLQNGDKLNSDLLGDIFILGKSMFISHPDGQMSLGLGLKIPTGKSVFDLTSKKLTTGDGSWDLFLGLFSEEKRGPFILYGDISYAFRFSFNANKIMGNTVNDMKIKPGNVVKWDIGAELPMGNILSLLLEVNGKLAFEGSADYNDGQSAADDVKKLSAPEITLERTNRINLLTGIQFNLAKTILITPAVWIPLKTTNNYSGITYLVSLSFKF